MKGRALREQNTEVVGLQGHASHVAEEPLTSCMKGKDEIPP
jgi:hypothetical protein